MGAAGSPLRSAWMIRWITPHPLDPLRAALERGSSLECHRRRQVCGAPIDLDDPQDLPPSPRSLSRPPGGKGRPLPRGCRMKVESYWVLPRRSSSLVAELGVEVALGLGRGAVGGFEVGLQAGQGAAEPPERALPGRPLCVGCVGRFLSPVVGLGDPCERRLDLLLEGEERFQVGARGVDARVPLDLERPGEGRRRRRSAGPGRSPAGRRRPGAGPRSPCPGTAAIE